MLTVPVGIKAIRTRRKKKKKKKRRKREKKKKKKKKEDKEEKKKRKKKRKKKPLLLTGTSIPENRTTFHGYGAVNLTLTCTDKTVQNSNWTAGQIYSDREVECQAVDTAVKPYQINAVA